ncbi:MAG: hypothetical protein DWP98_11895 [Bacteroidetes bacterium]|nr:MAG: hypothetical protein DWP98_11895 [Bacteroidota bacterium]NOG56789.1 hypothetical protein [Bacteroidota bacterium]
MIQAHLLFVLFFGFFSNQSTEYKLIKTIHKECNFISTDRLGNLYLVGNHSITMYNKSGDSLREFNSRKYGEITYIDATDPYKILVFFQDYNLIVFLDNYLSTNGSTIDLQELGYDQVSFACQSREKGIWIFDQLKQQLIKLNENLELSKSSINIGQWLGETIQPTYMVEQNNQLYMYCSNKVIYVFDHFGTFIKKIIINEMQNPQILQNHILYLNESQLCSYNLNTFETICQENSFKNLNQYRIEKDRIYFHNAKKSLIFSTN